MKKSNLTLKKAMVVLEHWQSEEDCCDKLVFVTDFSIHPQTKGFMLSLDLYIAGKSDNYTDGITSYFYGTILECINQAVDHINQTKQEMRNKI